mmetsp:Transcript_50058/g.113848  ORF Transcript_50058/g.113848 Transcript_50058/m.113848 type:complete len:216 (+) Transcript_50058:1103-1750(+)
MIDRVKDGLLQGTLCIFQAADVVPLDVGHLHNGLPQRGGVARAHGDLEVILTDGHGIQDLGINGLLVKIDEVHLLTDALKGGLSAELCQIRPYETMGVRSYILELHVGGELHVFGVDPEDLEAAIVIGNTDIQLAVKATKATESRIDGVWPVRRRDDNSVGAALHAIHEGQHLRHNALLDLTARLVALRRDGVDLVDKDNGWRVLLGLLEGFTQI